MVSSNMGLKSVVLALVMIIAVPTPSQASEAQTTTNAVVSFISQHKIAVVAIFGGFVIHTRLKTKARDSYKLEDLQEDFKELLHSFNIFEGKLYKQLLYMFDKYMIGLPIKLEDATTRKAKNENDEVVTVKSKKLTQKPFGAYGLFEAYVLLQMKPFMEYVPVIAGFYVLLSNPELSFENAVKKAQEGK